MNIKVGNGSMVLEAGSISDGAKINKASKEMKKRGIRHSVSNPKSLKDVTLTILVETKEDRDNISHLVNQKKLDEEFEERMKGYGR